MPASTPHNRTAQTIWRLIDTGPLAGPGNMAIDEALLSCFEPDTTPPVLRLYGWQPPALSLGRFQQADQVLDLARCRAAGVPVVRRITGGGVIYHAAELTYSLVCAPHHLPAASIKESFRHLTSFLLTFYRRLGLTAGYAVDQLPPGSRLGERTAFCFAGKETYDILVNGRKIGGNAQRRLRHAIFQHGSIPLHDRLDDALQYLREAPAGLAEGTTCLAAQGIDCREETLRTLLADAFRESMRVALTPTGPTPAEEAATARLLAKYRDDRWNLTGETGPV